MCAVIGIVHCSHSSYDHDSEPKSNNTSTLADNILAWSGVHNGSIYSLDWSDDGQCIATSSNDRTVVVSAVVGSRGIRGNTDRVRNTIAVHKDTVRHCCYMDTRSTLSHYVASCSLKEPKISVTDVVKCATFCSLTAGTQDGFVAIQAVKEEALLWAAKTGELFLFDLRTKKIPVYEVSAPTFTPSMAVKRCAFGTSGDAAPISCLSTSCHFLSTGFVTGHCATLDMRSQAWLGPVAIHEGECRAIDFSPVKHGHLLSCGFDSRVCTSDFIKTDGKPWAWNVRTVAKQESRVVNARWNRSGTYMLTTSMDDCIRLWRTTRPFDRAAY